MIDKDKDIEEYKALSQLLIDLVSHQKIVLRACFVIIVLSILMNLAIVGVFLWRESQWEYTSTTTTTTEQAVDGDDSDIINGNQYNKGVK